MKQHCSVVVVSVFSPQSKQFAWLVKNLLNRKVLSSLIS
ncbi:unnamed protein product [Larinioides sclopetarius]|uniref:Uncharacterized protein n=1 Tax=Larinioides sclopetarius TaxID=280406 RepID=A0AAV2BZS0_9ARAC